MAAVIEPMPPASRMAAWVAGSSCARLPSAQQPLICTARSVGSASLSPVGEGGSEPGLAHGGPTTRVIKYALPVFKPPDRDPMAEEYPTVESGLAAPKTQRQILPGQHAAMSVEIVCLGRVPQRALIYRLVTVRNLLIG